MSSTYEQLAESWVSLVQAWLPFWQSWERVSGCQEAIWANYGRMSVLAEAWTSWARLAPTYLSQTINPWSFSLVQFTKEIKGSPVLEQKILTEVAGYGSQLGTVIDSLEVVADHLSRDAGQLPVEEACKVEKLKRLATSIAKAKDRA